MPALAGPVDRARALACPVRRRGGGGIRGGCDAQYSVVMSDIKPPRLAGGEAETLHALLQYQRDSLVRKVAGLDEASVRWSPVGTGTSLLWLIKHMTRAEITWVLRRFAGQDVALPGDQPGPGDTLDAVTAAYRVAWQQVDRVAFAGADLDELCRLPDADPPVSLRWVLMHLLEETARHAGHADILRELIDGRTGR
jgi:uncharacterized damage-inducible protein DinB